MENNIKKIILLLTMIILFGGIFFGIKFYKNSKNTNITNGGDITNRDQTRTPFQTRVSTSTGVNTLTEETETVTNPDTQISSKPRLTQLWKEPVSGFDFVYKDIEVISTSTNATSSAITKIQNKKILKNQEFIYFWDRKTGHIYENLASTTDLEKISNYTSPGAEEVFFGDNSSLIVRKLMNDNETITTEYLKLIKEFSTSTVYNIEAKNIEIDSNNVSFLPSTKRLFYFIKNTGKGIISSIDGSVKTNSINTSLSELLPQFVNKDLVGLTTKPSAYFKGYLFSLNTNSSASNSYILGEKYGFNTLISPDGKKVIYNEIIDNTLESFIYDITSKSYIYLTQSTIVDKCTWSSNSKEVFCGIPQKLYEAPYPDAWYKNDVSFADNIWAIDSETGEFRIVIPLQDQVPLPIDVYNIKISNTGKYLMFQNKEDLTLWKYDLILE